MVIRHATYLLLLGKEELVRVHAICDSAADNREQVKNDRWLIGVLEKQLLENIEGNREYKEGCEAGGDGDGGGRVGCEVANRPRDLGEDTHAARRGSVRERCCPRCRGRAPDKFPRG